MFSERTLRGADGVGFIFSEKLPCPKNIQKKLGQTGCKGAGRSDRAETVPVNGGGSEPWCLGGYVSKL